VVHQIILIKIQQQWALMNSCNRKAINRLGQIRSHNNKLPFLLVTQMHLSLSQSTKRNFKKPLAHNRLPLKFWCYSKNKRKQWEKQKKWYIIKNTKKPKSWHNNKLMRKNKIKTVVTMMSMEKMMMNRKKVMMWQQPIQKGLQEGHLMEKLQRKAWKIN